MTNYPDYINQYLYYLDFNGRSKSTLKQYRSDLKKLSFYISNKYNLNSLYLLKQHREDILLNFESELSNKGLSDTSIKRIINVVLGLLKYHQIEIPSSLRKATEKRPQRLLYDSDFVTNEEFTCLLDSMAKPINRKESAARDFLIDRNIAILNLIRFYGLTPTQISNLNMSNINLGQGYITIKGEGTEGRNIKINQEHKLLITKYLNTFPNYNQLIYRTVHEDNPLFVAFNNKSMSYQVNYYSQNFTQMKRLSVRSIQKFIKVECNLGGLRKISAINLRNQYILDSLLKRISDKDLLKVLGLSSPNS